jgi:hypothetical protein
MKTSLVAGTALALVLAASLGSPAYAEDGGTDGGNGAVTVRSDAGSPEPVEMPHDEGCSAGGVPSSAATPLALGMALCVAAAFASRRRRR